MTMYQPQEAEAPARTLFDVKVALLGPTSSGKTTVLNALLGDEYGLVKEPTTSGNNASQEIVFYRLFGTATDGLHRDQVESFDNGSVNASTTASSHYPKSPVSSVVPPEVRRLNALNLNNNLQQALVAVDNTGKNTNTTATSTALSTLGGISERHVDVSLPGGDLFQMRDDTQLVFVDIPGLDTTSSTTTNSSATNTSSQCPYTSYVKTHWESFDCIIVVLDVTADPDHQENLLKFVKSQLDQRTRHPVLCLWNKLDDPYDPKGLEIIQQTQSLVNLVLSSDHQKAKVSRRSKETSTTKTVPFKLPPFLGQPFTFGPPMTEQELTKLQFKQSSDTTTTADTTTIATDLLEAPTTVQDGNDDPSWLQQQAQHEPANYQDNGPSLSTALAIPPPPNQPQLQFLPLSAKEALVYKRVKHMSLEEFANFMERDWMVERLGRDQIGLRRWNRLSRKEQVEETYYTLKDPVEHERALEECGFASVQRALGQIVGNHDGAQTLILETRMEFSLRALLMTSGSSGPDNLNVLFQQSPGGNNTTLLAPQLYSVYTRFQVLYGNTDAALALPQQLQTAFWAAYEKMEMRALQTVVEQGLGQVCALAEPMGQLLSYLTVTKALGWMDNSLVAKKAKHLILQFLQLLFEQESKYEYDGWGDHFQFMCHNAGKDQTMIDNNIGPWQALSPKSWVQVWSSILLLSYDRSFCQQFAREKVVIEELLERARQSWKSYGATLVLRICPYCVASLVPFKNEWRCPNSCRFAFHTCFPSTACNGCKHRFDDLYETEHVCPGNGYNYSAQQTLQVWMRTFYDRRQKLVPNFPALYNRVARLGDIPESLTDVNHMGHVFYQYCRLQEMLQ